EGVSTEGLIDEHVMPTLLTGRVEEANGQKSATVIDFSIPKPRCK
ncbi:MAG: hypothetical protein HC794_06485, partial [Nitrospiraceae bacterium]|nr:hypothetical protein [Nitrospiraceae bacterium]